MIFGHFREIVWQNHSVQNSIKQHNSGSEADYNSAQQKRIVTPIRRAAPTAPDNQTATNVDYSCMECEQPCFFCNTKHFFKERGMKTHVCNGCFMTWCVYKPTSRKYLGCCEKLINNYTTDYALCEECEAETELKEKYRNIKEYGNEEVFINQLS